MLAKPKKQVVRPFLELSQKNVYWPLPSPENVDSLIDLLIKDIKKQEPIIGLQKVTQALQRQAYVYRNGQELKSPIKYVVVCRSDIKPKLLTEHIPTLCWSASLRGSKIKLVQLPEGSLNKIWSALTENGDFSKKKASSYAVWALGGQYSQMDGLEDVKISWLEDLRFTAPQLKIYIGNEKRKEAKQAKIERRKTRESKTN